MTWIKNNQKLFLISFIIIAVAIAILSLLPPKSALNLGSKDKISHFIAYFTLSINAFLAWRISIKSIWLILVLISYGLLLEFLQGFVPGRDSSWMDALANSAGVLIGALTFNFFRVLMKKV